MGPYGALKTFKSRTTTPVYPDDVLTIRGRVAQKYVENGEGWIECEVWAEKQDGRISAKASGKVTLPLKGAR